MEKQTIDTETVAPEEQAAHDAANDTVEAAEGANVADEAAGTDTMADEPAAAGEPAADEAALWKDKFLRLQAEFDNYRKRTLKEKMELVERGGSEVLKAMLPVADDIDRALDAMRKSDDVEAIRSGVELIAQKFGDTLRARGVKEIEAVGLELDTDLHEAVARFPAGAEKSGRIIDVVQKGYLLGDKVLRFAKVVVGE